MNPLDRLDRTRVHHQFCVLCGDQNPLSLGLQFRAGENTEISTSFKGKSALQGYHGILHGGVIGALLDSAMTHCLFNQGIEAVTAEMKVRYLHEIPCDAELKLIARLVTQRKGLYRVQAEIRMAGKPMARSEGKFVIRRTTPV
ncbi:PaaI family thioesterase [Ferrimonas kyonanensis]|uniref:PaaI family thioesterase n=1 Tax=Ferrimonas kyonanensis TaxID=364763 RepID=UPI000421C0C8|nr:PaaI family thioesterase [Ferrimonas kyonanensis]